MKTIFIIISRAFIIRNVLRSGGLDLMEKKGYRVIVFLSCPSVPDYLREEFAGRNIIIEASKNFTLSKIHKLFNLVTNYLLFTDSTKRYLKYGNQRLINRLRIKTYLNLIFVWLISKSVSLKILMRWLEIKLFPESYDYIRELFDKYSPSLVFSTSVITGMDIIFMKEAKRRGIKTVSMPKGWDNITRNYYRYLPDYFIVQNEILKERTVNLQNFSPDKIFVTGFPQFDWYARKEIIRPKEEHFKKLGLDPNLSLIFFGSEGRWADKDYLVARKIYEWVKNNELIKPCQMLVRPHFSNVKDGLFLEFKNQEKIAVDETYHISNYFIDNWDPTDEETIDLANTLYYSDILITIISTLNLDAVCYDKPSINIGYGCKFRHNQDITPWLYTSDHSGWVLETKGVELVINEEELKNKINEYLINPDINKKEREVLRKKLCYKVDGHSSKRMVESLDFIINNKINNDRLKEHRSLYFKESVN
jgi:hypothetical protein